MRCVGASSLPAKARMSRKYTASRPHLPPLVALWQKSDNTTPGSTRRGTRTGPRKIKKTEPPKKKNSTTAPTHPEPRAPTHPIIFNSL